MWINKRWLMMLVSFLLVISLVTGSMLIEGKDSIGSANNQTQIKQLERQIEELRRKQIEARQTIREIEKEKKQLRAEELQLLNEVQELDLQISETELAMLLKEEEISETQEAAYQATLELQDAEQRVERRDQLIRTRLKTMYETGSINYLEVLLGSQSFSDFMNRIDFLRLLIEEDQRIFEEFIAMREEVEQKKNEIEAFLAQLEQQFDELQAIQAFLVDQEKNKSIRIAEIAKIQQDLAAQEEEEAQNAIRFANEISRANKEIEKLRFDGIFEWPVPSSYRITSQFGLRRDPFTGQQRGHNGLDIGAPTGSNIVSVSGGIVVVAEYLSGYGNTVIIDHGNNVRSLYAHIRNGGIKVRVGARVRKGQKIAEVGSTGRSTGPHLHLEVHENGVHIDPMKYLKR
jgi:murein DD-endopeptidase MepM/ murein hydrolase activator NlpD